jgi:hypothetical protein
MNLYRNESSKPKWNAQRNLQGRTHYVDDDTLRWHKARVLSARHVDNGLLFAIVESVALDMNNTKRGYRYAIFDVFGTILERPTLENSFKTSAQATKAMWAKLDELDAVGITLSAISRAEHYHAREMTELRATLQSIGKKAA